jgi:hypothetical protein
MTSSTITLQTITVTASTSNGVLSNLRVNTGGAIGNCQFDNFDQEGIQTHLVSNQIGAGQESTASVTLSTPKHSKGKYLISVDFTYQ